MLRLQRSKVGADSRRVHAHAASPGLLEDTARNTARTATNSRRRNAPYLYLQDSLFLPLPVSRIRPRWPFCPSVSRTLTGLCCTRKREERIRLIAHDPCIVTRLDDCEVAWTKLRFGSVLHECPVSPGDEKLSFTTDFMMFPAVLEMTKLRIAVQNLRAGVAASAEYRFL